MGVGNENAIEVISNGRLTGRGNTLQNNATGTRTRPIE
jgi:hypothetical protein